MIETAYSHRLVHDRTALRSSLERASTTPFWLDHPDRPRPRATLSESITSDLVIVGGGYCGLWTALIAKERDPSRRVVVLEANSIGYAASGRNGGFVEASLTHGEANGELHFAKEMPTLGRLAAENFAAFADTLVRYGIDAEYEAEPTLTVATEPHQVPELREASENGGGEFLEPDDLAPFGTSALYRAGLLTREGNALVHPAKLAWGLARAAEQLGVEIHEHTHVRKLERTRSGVIAQTWRGSVTAKSVALATNGFPSLLKRLQLFTVPIYDYVLMTEPLSNDQLEAIGWTERNGITDSSREFHYYRKSADNRILFGGYDAVYHRGGTITAEHDQRPETFERLADHFFSTFPQLSGIRFTHRWGGMIDMSTQLAAFHGATRDRRIAYSAGYTGLGVCATRFGAETMLDFLEGRDTDRTGLSMSRRLPIPIPPEPLANPLIQTMRTAVAKSDANEGKDGVLLKAAALFGVGFDS